MAKLVVVNPQGSDLAHLGILVSFYFLRCGIQPLYTILSQSLPVTNKASLFSDSGPSVIYVALLLWNTYS